MADSYYPEPDSGADESASEGSVGQGYDGTSALVPLSLIGDAKPGDTITLKVVRLLEDEAELAPSSEETKEEESPSADQEIDMMAEQTKPGRMGGMM